MKINVDRRHIRNEFVRRVEEISGQNLYKCYQCGKCSAGCPVIEEMDMLPSQVIRLCQMGDEGVLNCRTIWICASCLTCSVRCPKGIDIAGIMEALRLMLLRRNVDVISIDGLGKNELMTLPQIAIVASFRKNTA